MFHISRGDGLLTSASRRAHCHTRRGSLLACCRRPEAARIATPHGLDLFGGPWAVFLSKTGRNAAKIANMANSCGRPPKFASKTGRNAVDFFFGPGGPPEPVNQKKTRVGDQKCFQTVRGPLPPQQPPSKTMGRITFFSCSEKCRNFWGSRRGAGPPWQTARYPPGQVVNVLRIKFI